MGQSGSMRVSEHYSKRGLAVRGLGPTPQPMPISPEAACISLYRNNYGNLMGCVTTTQKTVQEYI